MARSHCGLRCADSIASETQETARNENGRSWGTREVGGGEEGGRREWRGVLKGSDNEKGKGVKANQATREQRGKRGKRDRREVNR